MDLDGFGSEIIGILASFLMMYHMALVLKKFEVQKAIVKQMFHRLFIDSEYESET